MTYTKEYLKSLLKENGIDKTANNSGVNDACV